MKKQIIDNKAQNTPVKEAPKKDSSIFKVKPVKTQNAPLLEQGCIR